MRGTDSTDNKSDAQGKGPDKRGVGGTVREDKRETTKAKSGPKTAPNEPNRQGKALNERIPQMNATVPSRTRKNVTYRLTIEANSGKCIDCTCPDMKYRGNRDNHTCVHMQEYEVQLQRASAFILLRRTIEETEQSVKFNRDENARRNALHACFNVDGLN